ncbi:MAG: hypothetical protein K1Y36_09415 [Blastocatellia bacterium]|nr:hypothetical protein [Blastocatellia bacterium]
MHLKPSLSKRLGVGTLVSLILLGSVFFGLDFKKKWTTARADSTAQVVPFTQNWTTTTLITANDNWSGVPGIEGFLGQDITTATGADPQTLLTTSALGSDLDVIANQANPNTNTAGGVGEFDGIANPTIALQGSGTADAPYVIFYLNTTGQSSINVAYNLRDIDGSADNAIQPVALQYRVGNTGNFTNVPAGFVADATTGPSLATLVTPVSATLPPACDNQALVQVRVITANAVGSDEWVGVDDISITAGGGGGMPGLTVTDVTQAEGNAGTTTFNFMVNLSSPAGVGGVTFNIATADGTATTANNDYMGQTLNGQTIAQGNSSFQFSVTVNGDTTPEPNETFFVNVTSVTGATVIDGQGVGTINNDDVVITSINAIQGPGSTSPFANQMVVTTGVVTGLRSNGYYIQNPDANIDSDPNTSEGIFVFTGNPVPAAAAIGNLVQVSGMVIEFRSTSAPTNGPTLTEFSNGPTTTLLSTGNAIPTATTITAADTNPNGAFEQLEKFEGMRLRINSLTVCAPTDGFKTETAATSTSSGVFWGVVTGVARPFRETGIEFPKGVPVGGGVTIPPVPQFDGNPEKIRFDDGQPGSATLDVTTGAVITNLVGVLDPGGFPNYTFYPEAATTPVVTGNVTFTPTPVPGATELTVASFNLERFYDNIDDAGGDVVLTTTAFNNRLNKASLAIRNVIRTPDVVGVIEMEDLKTLQALATKINNDAVAASQPNPMYTAFLVEGNDVGLIDVGFLVKSSRINVVDVTQFGKTDTYINPNNGAAETLNDRPPLVLRATVPTAGNFAFTVIVNHLRSLNGVDDDTPDGTGTAGTRVRAKRRAQAEFLANLIQARQLADPTERIISVGDYNAFQFNDGLGDSMGTIKGTPTPANMVVAASPDLVNPDLVNLVETEPSNERYSFVFDGNAQVLDHALITSNLMSRLVRFNHGRVNGDFPEVYRSDAMRPERVSDHDPLVVTLETNQSPAISAQGVSVSQGGTTTGATIATVTDAETPAGSLTVTAQTVPAGLTVSNIVNTNGTVTATVAATCSATVGANTVVLQVTDGNGATTTTNLTVTVTANTPPTLGTYPATGVSVGGGATVTPSAAPTDNGSVVSLTAAAPGFTGTLTGNPATGVITVANANSGGPFTVTVTATDNCGATSTATFTITTNTAPTITPGVAISRQQGSTGTVSTIATVSDVDQTAGTLTVTAQTVPTGIMVTGITNTNGTITATVTAACSATLGANTVVLRVQDSGGLSTTANLTVNVTANTAPTVGAYPNMFVTAGTTATVAPATPPADNGTVASVTVAASAGFAGTISVTPAGVVTALPSNSGAFTVTVTITDNCGATSTATFSMFVQAFGKSPVVNSLSPTSGTIGTSVTLTGFNFTNVNTVTFNGVAASFTIDSATQITATVPAGATTGTVNASSTSGTGVGPTFTVIRTK